MRATQRKNATAVQATDLRANSGDSTMRMRTAVFTLLSLAAAAAAAQSPAPGVTKTEITLGTIQDLSGPLAAYGKQIRMGMQMRVDELNEMGGVHGRKIRLLLED